MIPLIAFASAALIAWHPNGDPMVAGGLVIVGVFALAYRLFRRE